MSNWESIGRLTDGWEDKKYRFVCLVCKSKRGAEAEHGEAYYCPGCGLGYTSWGNGLYVDTDALTAAQKPVRLKAKRLMRRARKRAEAERRIEGLNQVVKRAKDVTEASARRSASKNRNRLGNKEKAVKRERTPAFTSPEDEDASRWAEIELPDKSHT